LLCKLKASVVVLAGDTAVHYVCGVRKELHELFQELANARLFRGESKG
jgi:hypothetical protein